MRYLAEVPLPSAGLGRRLVAKCLDVAAVFGAAAVVALILWAVVPEPFVLFIPVLCVGVATFAFIGYTVVAEYRSGGTIGKRLMGIQVVRESGARISLGQSLLRQLPFFGQFYLLDAVFSLFTERRQRAFELLTKTRAVALLVCLGILPRVA